MHEVEPVIHRHLSFSCCVSEVAITFINVRALKLLFPWCECCVAIHEYHDIGAVQYNVKNCSEHLNFMILELLLVGM